MHIDQTILPCIKIKSYDLFPKLPTSIGGQISTISCPILGLDGCSLINLEIFQNSIDGSNEGTLFEALDYCFTPMGRRKLRNWLTHPLTSVPMIKARQDSITMLCRIGSSLEKFISSYLKGLPDIERLLSRALSKQARLKEYVQLLDSYALIISFLTNLRSHMEKQASSFDSSSKSSKLYSIAFEHNLNLDYLESVLTTLRNSFDRKSALDKGELKLNPGQHSAPEYSTIEENISVIEKSLDSFASQIRKELK